MSRVSFLFFSMLLACGASEPKTPAKSAESVPANSFKDEPQPSLAASEPPKDPTQPYMTKVGDPADAPRSGPTTTSATRVSQAECDQMFDKLIDLEVASNPQLKGAGPDVVALAKQMARERGGAPPCTASPTEYRCAMAATSTAGWKRCVK